MVKQGQGRSDLRSVQLSFLFVGLFSSSVRIWLRSRGAFGQDLHDVRLVSAGGGDSLPDAALDGDGARLSLVFVLQTHLKYKCKLVGGSSWDISCFFGGKFDDSHNDPMGQRATKVQKRMQATAATSMTRAAILLLPSIVHI